MKANALTVLLSTISKEQSELVHLFEFHLDSYSTHYKRFGLWKDVRISKTFLSLFVFPINPLPLYAENTGSVSELFVFLYLSSGICWDSIKWSDLNSKHT